MGAIAILIDIEDNSAECLLATGLYTMRELLLLPPGTELRAILQFHIT